MHKIIDLNLFSEPLRELAKHRYADADETFRRYAMCRLEENHV